MVMVDNSYYNHQEGFAQPSLTSQVEIKFSEKLSKKSLCVGCAKEIQDQYILRVSPDLEWHSACLRCHECNQFLDENCTCFVKDGKTYCKRDYVRLFGTKCDKCGYSFSKNDFVMRAKTKIFHLKCFKCTVCEKQLNPGDEFALRENNVLYCKSDHDQMQKKQEIKCEKVYNENPSEQHTNSSESENCTNSGRKYEFGEMCSDSESDSDSVKVTQRRGRNSCAGINGKQARVRTVLNEKQLGMLRACYNMNSRPDALVKEQLVEMTGLSSRVIRVWFQNKRCKDKKKSLEYKSQIQQEKESKISFMCGVPLIASPPIKHEPGMNYHGYEVTKYQPPWRALSTFSDAILNHSDFNNTPGFQHLVNQLHGYDAEDEMKGNNYNDFNSLNRDGCDSYHGSEESFTESL